MKIKLYIFVVFALFVNLSEQAFSSTTWPTSHPDKAFYENLVYYSDQFDFYLWEEGGSVWAEIIPTSGIPFVCSSSFVAIQNGIQNDDIVLEQIGGKTLCTDIYVSTVVKVAFRSWAPYKIDFTKPFTLLYEGSYRNSLVTMNVPALIKCNYSISSSSGSFSSSGGNKNLSVTASSTSCSWTTSENLNWVSLSPTEGTGSRNVSISVSPNAGAERSGSIIIAGRTYRISQDEAPCTFNINPSSGTFSSGGGTKNLSLTASSPRCSWTASESLTWLSVSPINGSGNRNITITVTPNIGAARSGAIVIGDKIYIVTQAAAYNNPISGLTKTQVSQLYVSIFGRASEGEGNAYWQSQSDMATAASAMLDTDAAKNYFGANLNTNQAFIEHIYLNTLNKTISDDFDGISYWVNMLNAGTSRGEAVATLIRAINDYAPGGPNYDPDDTATVAAYNQFMNRVVVSNYIAENVYTAPDDWETSTSFSHGMVVTDDPATMVAAKVVINGFTDEPLLSGACGAYVAPSVWKEFDCYNLAAIGKTTNDDPFTPSWRLIGGYWQWGRKGADPSQWYDTNTTNFAHGPTGPGVDEANEGEISNWDDDYAPDGAWSDEYKTANDPCPDGFRVPTDSQWKGVDDNNTQSTVGTWDHDDTNYASARFFGSELMLPAAGFRYGSIMALGNRGYAGAYWSSSEDINYGAWSLYFPGGDVYTDHYSRLNGFSVRCIAE
jgi:uncharacterized protein (TIGR02145 family)